MALERKFVQDSVKKVQVARYLEKKLGRAGFSKATLQRTPMITRISIQVGNPARVIGRAGRDIKSLSDELQANYGLENPQIDVTGVENENLDPMLVCRKIARLFDRGDKARKVLHIALQDMQSAGVQGAEIYVGGKLVGKGAKARGMRISYGRVPKSGNLEGVVRTAQLTTYPKAGAIGIEVRIVPKGVVFSDAIARPHAAAPAAPPAEVATMPGAGGSGPEAPIERASVEQEKMAELESAIAEKKVEAEKPKPAPKKRAPRKKKEEGAPKEAPAEKPAEAEKAEEKPKKAAKPKEEKPAEEKKE